MSPRETDALIAYHLFGWRWYSRESRCAMFPPDDGKWIRWNFYPDFREISHWPEPGERFSDWDRCGSPEGYRENPRLGWLPRYSTDPAAALSVIDRLRAAGIEVIIGWFRDGVSVELCQWREQSKGIPGIPQYVRSRVTFYCRTGQKSMPQAVCKAALHPETLAALAAAKSNPAAAMPAEVVEEKA